MKRHWHIVYKKSPGDIVLACSGESEHYIPNVIDPMLQADDTLASMDVSDQIEEFLPGATDIATEKIPQHNDLKEFTKNVKFDATSQKLIRK